MTIVKHKALCKLARARLLRGWAGWQSGCCAKALWRLLAPPEATSRPNNSTIPREYLANTSTVTTNHLVKQKYHYPVEPSQAPALSPARPEKCTTTVKSQWQDHTRRCKGANRFAIFLCSVDVEIYIDDNLDDNLVGRLTRCKGAWSSIAGSIFGCITISVHAKVTNPWIGTPINPPGVSLCMRHITHTQGGPNIIYSILNISHYYSGLSSRVTWDPYWLWGTQLWGPWT